MHPTGRDLKTFGCQIGNGHLLGQCARQSAHREAASQHWRAPWGKNAPNAAEGSTTFDYFYDARNRLKRADAFGGSIFLEYDAAGRRTPLSRPNGIRTAYEYDDANQVLGIVHSKGPQVVLGFTYGYDLHGMRTSKTRETGYREDYGYDAAGRLVRVDYGTAKRVEYSLDNVGNRVLEDTTTSPSTGLARKSGSFNAFNRNRTAVGVLS